jgi:hypothetical protein
MHLGEQFFGRFKKGKPHSDIKALVSPDWRIDILNDDKAREIADQNPTLWEDGEILHVYRSSKGFGMKNCPLCKQSISRFYVGVIYAIAEQATRQHIGPCASICSQCKAAVIDEDLPRRSAAQQKNTYLLPLSFFPPRKGAPKINNLTFFSTYEGQKPTFLLDENGYIQDVMYSDQLRWQGDEKYIPTRKDRDNKKLRKRQRQARKISRKHRH